MIRLLCISILFFVSSDLFGQNGNSGLGPVKQGNSFNSSRKSNFSGFFGRNDQTVFAVDYLAINRKKQELNLRRFEASTMELVDSRELFTVIDEEFYNEPNEVFFQDNTIFLFSTLSGLKKKFNLIYLEIFNEYGEKITERIVDTLEVDEKYTISEAIEQKGFLIASHNKFDNIFEQTIHLQAINVLGETDWETMVKSPVSLQNLKIVDLKYSLNAPVYILCDYGFEGSSGQGSVRENNTDLLNNKYALWAYDHNKSFLKEFDIRFKNRWLNGLELTYNSKLQLVISGFINETRNQTINGVFSLIINPDLTVSSSSYYKYKKSFYEKFVAAKNLDKVKELKDIEIRNCVVLADDSYFILGEHYYQYTDRNYDPRTNITTTTENYNYNSIIVAYFDAEGNHRWTDRIPKYQHTINDYGYYSSFSTMKYKNELFLFFNDTDRNNDVALGDYFNYNDFAFNRRFQISYVSINEDGIQSRGPLVNSDNNFMLRAKQCQQIDPSTFYLFGEVGKSRKLFSVQPNNLSN